jgi:hypothetical protein
MEEPSNVRAAFPHRQGLARGKNDGRIHVLDCMSRIQQALCDDMWLADTRMQPCSPPRMPSMVMLLCIQSASVRAQ